MDQDRVLLIDDEVMFVETLAARLTARGLQVETATNGEAGIKLALSQSFHAVILDFAMPGIDGVETLKRLREHRPELQVMLLTGQATVKAAVEATRLGAVDVLEKPTDIDTLLEKIRKARIAYVAATEKRSQEQAEKIIGKYGW